jgi:hypothetical protein
MGGLMFRSHGFAIDTTISVMIVILVQFVLGYFQRRAAKRKRGIAEQFSNNLKALCSPDTAVVSISRSEEGPVTLSVIDEWTEYTETCFIQASMENAVEEALAYKNSRKR